MKKLFLLLFLCPLANYSAPKLPPTKNFGLFMQRQQKAPKKSQTNAPPPVETPPLVETPPPPPAKPQTNIPPPPPPVEVPPSLPPAPAAPQPLPDFFAAIRAGDADSVRNFLAGGLSPGTREHGSQGATALIAAVGARQEEITALLLAEGADVNASATVNGVQGISPLMVASQGGTMPIVKMLTGAGAHVNAVTGGISAGNTALMAAVHAGRTEILEFLIANGADVNVKNASGSSALMISAQLGRLDALKLLLKSPGIRISDVDYHGNDALGLARRAGQKEAVRIIYYTR